MVEAHGGACGALPRVRQVLVELSTGWYAAGMHNAVAHGTLTQ